MAKVVSEAEAEQNFKAIIREIELNKTDVVVESEGETVAVVISQAQYEILKKARRKRFMELLELA
jgi:PHD/YefM family antitoxin component YafN of YafNO toxin-antitoxin module